MRDTIYNIVYRSTLNFESQRDTVCNIANWLAELLRGGVIGVDREAAMVEKGQVTIFVPFLFNFYGNAQFCMIVWFIVMWNVCKITDRNTFRVYFWYAALCFCVFTSLNMGKTGPRPRECHMHFYVAKFILLIFMISPLISLNSQ